MYRAHRAHHQEGQFVSIQPLVTVTPFTPNLHTTRPPTQSGGYQSLYWSVCLSWWWVRGDRNT